MPLANMQCNGIGIGHEVTFSGVVCFVEEVLAPELRNIVEAIVSMHRLSVCSDARLEVRIRFDMNAGLFGPIAEKAVLKASTDEVHIFESVEYVEVEIGMDADAARSHFEREPVSRCN
jgi:hypothetical protein